jgi:DNA-binding transcriptional MerR regulator
VCFIRKAQSLGFSLDEIWRIMSLRGQGRETCRCVIAIAEATLAETQTKLKELRKFKDMLAANDGSRNGVARSRPSSAL